MQQLAQTQGALAGALGRFTAVAEAYPDLKANQNMMQLSEELTSTENKVAFARQAYNDSVMSYNNQREVVPGQRARRHVPLRPRPRSGRSRRPPGDARRAEGPVLSRAAADVNFFDRQRAARGTTVRLVVLFVARRASSIVGDHRRASSRRR